MSGSKVKKMVQVEIEEASGNLPELIDRAVSGEEIIITQASKPIVRLVLMEEAEQALLREQFEVDNSLVEDMLSAFEEEIAWSNTCIIFVANKLEKALAVV